VIGRLAAGLVATALVTVSPLAASMAVGTPGPATMRVQEEEAPTIVLVDQPIAVAPDGDFTVLAQAVGAGEAREFAVDIYGRVPAGEAIGPVPDRDPVATFGPTSVAPDPGGEANLGFRIQLYRPGEDNPDPRWGHRLAEPGVYPVRIRLRDGEGDSIAVLMTTLLRLPDVDQPVAPATASLLVDLSVPPPERAGERRSEPEADRSLVRSSSAVIEALSARPELPATFSVTPDTLERWAADDGAAAELGQLRQALNGPDRTVLDATYVDLDTASMVADGIGAELVPQRDAGRQTLTGLLEAPTSEIWRLRDRIDEPVVAVLRALEVSGLVLPDGAIADDPPTPSPVSFESPIGAIRAATASDALLVGAAAPDDPVLDAHRLLARLASLPGTAAVVSVDPETAARPTLDILFDALSFGIPFVQTTTIDDLLAGPDPPDATPAVPEIRPLGGYPKALQDARASLGSYASMVPDRPELTRPYEQTLLVSASRDLSPDAATGDARSVTRALDEPFGAIDTPERDTVTLGARDATFPLTVESSLPYPVRVVVELQSSDRVEFPRNRLETTLEPGRQEIDLRVKVRTAGDTPVRISIRTPDDRILLSQSRYTIRSTAVSGVGVLLTISAAAFLAIWWGRHWHRNRNEIRPGRGRPTDPTIV
jgi:hypothetical protein